MNISILEKIARQVVKGQEVTGKSDAMLKSGVIGPAEHRSLKSLSWQIAANMQANTDSSTLAIKVQPYGGWW